MRIIAIDTGTTNTRLKLWENGIAISSYSMPVGVRDVESSGKDYLYNAIKVSIEETLKKVSLSTHDVDYFFASGMITSNLGICEVEHILTPAGLDKIAANIVVKKIPQVMDEYIHFIPGVKNSDNSSVESNDMMRGEEVETIGLMKVLNIEEPCIVVLPGSHCKFIRINHKREIDFLATTLSGELLWALTKNTILASSLNSSFVGEIDREMLLMGASYCEVFGVSRAAFMVRSFDYLLRKKHDEKASYLLGVVCAEDIKAMKNTPSLKLSKGDPIYIAGRDNTAQALRILMENLEDLNLKVKQIPQEFSDDLSGKGVLLIAEKYFEQKSETKTM